MRVLWKLFKSCFISALGFLVIAVLATFFYAQTQLPAVNNLTKMRVDLPLKIYTADGKFIQQFGDKNRQLDSINNLPKQLIDAIVATEDQNYFNHPGVDIIALIRAAENLYKTRKLSQGGSTITMQVARNYLLTREKTFTRKAKEILLAYLIEREYSKKEIMELYFNKIFFGHRAYSITAAAQTYYGKTVAALTLPETATLIGLIKAPSSLNPITNPIAAKHRRNYVLDRMYQEKYITKDQYYSAIKAKITAKYHPPKPEAPANYVAEMVRQYMTKKFGQEAYTSGFKVYTTIISKLQQKANKAIDQGLESYKQRFRDNNTDQVQGALIAMNPKNGAILALAGGEGFFKSKFNRVTQSKLQIGSSIKPFIYSAALAKDAESLQLSQGETQQFVNLKPKKMFSLATVAIDEPFIIYNGKNDYWAPKNSNNKFIGPVSLRKAIHDSKNVITVKLLNKIGTSYTRQYMKNFGFTNNDMPNDLSLALGTATASPLQLTRGYAVFANGGYLVKPHFIKKIVNGLGREIKIESPNIACDDCAENSAPRTIDNKTVFLITSAMQDTIRKGTGRRALALNRSDLAGKTGTTNEFRDAWFVGFNHDIVATTWVGYDHTHFLKSYASQVALPIWVDFMKTALQDSPETDFIAPAGIVRESIDPETGNLSMNENAIDEYFRLDNIPNYDFSAFGNQQPMLF